ncbi:hypothetical protein RHGRI_026335 [Rhododendron griersonianum]|uniref:Uncharacterized protein n=1 Tax=Rhododendron griersonianum TaxID=479676 RepID=A0AAV6IYN1_9ERIC|nr:hypothetical protein RHGRI_026335 [Rhododendron griersonianum]
MMSLTTNPCLSIQPGWGSALSLSAGGDVAPRGRMGLAPYTCTADCRKPFLGSIENRTTWQCGGVPRSRIVRATRADLGYLLRRHFAALYKNTCFLVIGLPLNHLRCHFRAMCFCPRWCPLAVLIGHVVLLEWSISNSRFVSRKESSWSSRDRTTWERGGAPCSRTVCVLRDELVVFPLSTPRGRTKMVPHDRTNPFHTTVTTIHCSLWRDLGHNSDPAVHQMDMGSLCSFRWKSP